MKFLLLSVFITLLSGCYTTSKPIIIEPFSGELREISGADIVYTPYHPNSLNDYDFNGQLIQIVKQPEKYSQTGYATVFGNERNSQLSLTGELINASDLIAAHPTLPLPSYARITNLNNGRQLIVRINDRSNPNRATIIDLSEGAAFRLNMAAESNIRVDVILVSPSGELSGPGIYGSTVAKQSYALPERPVLFL